MAGAPASIDGVPGGRERLARHKANIIGEEHELVSGCTFSGPRPAVGNSIPRKPKPWTPPSPGGGVAGRAADGPEASPDGQSVSGP
ncbi:hypothetical protein [Arthrobacter sp. D1-17]